MKSLVFATIAMFLCTNAFPCTKEGADSAVKKWLFKEHQQFSDDLGLGGFRVESVERSIDLKQDGTAQAHLFYRLRGDSIDDNQNSVSNLTHLTLDKDCNVSLEWNKSLVPIQKRF